MSAKFDNAAIPLEISGQSCLRLIYLLQLAERVHEPNVSPVDVVNDLRYLDKKAVGQLKQELEEEARKNGYGH